MIMDIPQSKLDMITEQHSSNLQCRRECCRVFLTEHPSPSWQLVAYALYIRDHTKELEVVQRKYLKGERAIIMQVLSTSC